MTTDHSTQPGGRLALLLALITSVTPLAIDAYLPALPAIAEYYGVSIQLVENSVSTYMLGYALGMLFGAPFSDRKGRRRATAIGLGVFVIATGFILISTTAEQLLWLRFLQALGGGWAAVNSGAIVRDLFDEQDSARMLSMIMLIMLGVPLVAPALGAGLLFFFSWHSVFVALGVYALLALLLTMMFLPETVKTRQQVGVRLVLSDLGQTARKIVSEPSALGFMLSGCFASGCLFIFLTDAAFVYLEYKGLPSTTFVILFAVNVLAMAGFQRANLALLKYRSPRRILPIGFALQLVSALGLAGYTYFGHDGLAAIVLGIMLVIGAQGFIYGNALAAFLAHFDERIGVANAFAGSLNFAVGAMLGILLSIVHDGTPFTLAAGMVASSTFAAFFGLLALRPKAAGDDDETTSRT